MHLNVPKGGFRHEAKFMTRREAMYTSGTTCNSTSTNTSTSGSSCTSSPTAESRRRGVKRQLLCPPAGEKEAQEGEEGREEKREGELG